MSKQREEKERVMDTATKLILHKALDLYTEWLSRHYQANGVGRVAPAAFLDDKQRKEASIPLPEREEDRYGHSWWQGGAPETLFFPRIDCFGISDGDDGGPTRLVTWAEGSDIKVITQEFDSQFQVIWDDAGYHNLPG